MGCCVVVRYMIVVLLVTVYMRCLLFACVVDLMICWLVVVMRCCFSVCVFVCV